MPTLDSLTWFPATLILTVVHMMLTGAGHCNATLQQLGEPRDLRFGSFRTVCGAVVDLRALPAKHVCTRNSYAMATDTHVTLPFAFAFQFDKAVTSTSLPPTGVIPYQSLVVRAWTLCVPRFGG